MGSLTSVVPTEHNLLGSLHEDTTANTPNAGDLIRGSAVPASWERFTVGSATQIIGVSSGLPAWSAQTYIDHGSITGLGDDDHSLYLLASDATNRTTFATNWTDLTDTGATTLHKHDHGGLDGLTDDDHTQYVLRSVLTTRGDLPVRGASDWARLGVGAANTVLTANGTDPAWSATPTVTTLTTTGLLTAGSSLTVSAGNLLAASSILSVGTSATTAQANILSGAAGRIGLIVDTAASPSQAAQEWRVNGTRYFLADIRDSLSQFGMDAVDLGNNVAGPGFILGSNLNTGTEGKAAGGIYMVQANGPTKIYWTDANGLLRIHSAAPTGSSGTPTVADTAGSVVGDQTSWHEAKDVLGPTRTSPAEALAAIVGTPIFDFRYKENSYLTPENRPQVFTGIVGYDKHDWFLKNVGRQQNPALNEITFFGYTVQAIKALDARVRALEV